MRALMLAGFASLAALSAACLWDRDTLAYEARQFPEAIDVLTGRFERNPPLYYEMRLDRVSRLLRAKPDDLELYDDAAVAEERLGQSAEAIRWMERKEAAMDRLRIGASDEHRYRYHANLGTFLAHRFFREGASRERLDVLRQGRDHIAQAIDINPQAHFGRERVQLVAMQWTLDQLTGTANERSLSSALAKAGVEKPAKGLMGLVVLGNAWESVDVMDALAMELRRQGHASLSTMASLRAEELLRSGHASLVHDRAAKAEWQPSGPQDANVQAKFKELRAAADRWSRSREAFMTERLKEGRHPDTDAQFWNGFAAPPRPNLGPLFNPSYLTPTDWFVAAIVGLVGLAVTAFIMSAAKRHRRQRSGTR